MGGFITREDISITFLNEYNNNILPYLEFYEKNLRYTIKIVNDITLSVTLANYEYYVTMIFKNLKFFWQLTQLSVEEKVYFPIGKNGFYDVLYAITEDVKNLD